MTEEMKKAFDFAADLAKQLITLASAIIATIITFFEKSTSSTTSQPSVKALMIPLSIYLLSIIFGVGALMALTGALVKNQAAATPDAMNARAFSGVQIISFLVATGWSIWTVVTLSR